MADNTEHLVWIDCEMTGLDLGNDALIEVAAIVTDGQLNPLDDGLDVIIHASDEVLDGMIPLVRDMHASSGLTDAVRASRVDLATAQEQVLGYIRAHVREARSAPLCGNSIATDRGFLARDMPELTDYLHYRMIDVSSIKELAKRWYPRVYQSQPKKALGHRALADIVESIDELRYYRGTLFVPQPGPTLDEARSVADTVISTSGRRVD